MIKRVDTVLNGETLPELQNATRSPWAYEEMEWFNQTSLSLMFPSAPSHLVLDGLNVHVEMHGEAHLDVKPAGQGVAAHALAVLGDAHQLGRRRVDVALAVLVPVEGDLGEGGSWHT